MSTTLGEINTKLAEIKDQLDKIDFEKETDPKKIDSMIIKILGETKDVIERESFGEEHLSAIVELFKKAEETANGYDPKKDAENILKNRSKAKEISDTINARKKAKEEIVNKFNELTKKQEVISKYKEKYDPQHLKDRQENKSNANLKKIDSNNKRIIEIADFKSKVENELKIIKTNLELIKELDELEKIFDKCEKLERDFLQYKNQGIEKDVLDVLEKELEEEQKKLGEKCKNVNTNNKGLKITPKSIKTDKPQVISIAKNLIVDAKADVNKKVVDSEKNYGYTAGFENFMGAKLGNVSDEEFINVFEQSIKELEAENIDYVIENKNIQTNIDSLGIGMAVQSTEQGLSNVEPTEEEINAVIEANPEIKALAKSLTKKEEKKEIYKFLTEGKKGKFHPIALLRSKFDRTAEKKWRKNYELNMKQAAIKKITETKSGSESTRKKFMDALVHKVMTAKESEVDEWNKNADNKPGKVLTDVYDKMDNFSR